MTTTTALVSVAVIAIMVGCFGLACTYDPDQDKKA